MEVPEGFIELDDGDEVGETKTNDSEGNRKRIISKKTPTWYSNSRRICILCKYNRPNYQGEWTIGVCMNKNHSRGRQAWKQYMSIECDGFEYIAGSKEKALEIASAIAKGNEDAASIIPYAGRPVVPPECDEMYYGNAPASSAKKAKR